MLLHYSIAAAAIQLLAFLPVHDAWLIPLNSQVGGRISHHHQRIVPWQGRGGGAGWRFIMTGRSSSTDSSSSTEHSVTIEEESPVLLKADLEGLSAEDAVAWVHAWCASDMTTSSSSSSIKGKPMRPGLPSTSLPVKASLTGMGARLMCQGLGPAFLDLQVYDHHYHHSDDAAEGPSSSIVVRTCLSPEELSRHSVSIRGLAKDTERAILQKLKLDLTHTKVANGKGQRLGVAFYSGEGLNLMPPPPTSSSPFIPPPGLDLPEPELIDSQPSSSSSSSSVIAEDVMDISSAKEDSSSLDDNDNDNDDDLPPMPFKELMDTLGLGDLGLGEEDLMDDEDDAEGRKKRAAAWAKPDSPFAQKAMEAYETYMKGQAQGQENVAGMKEVVLEELRASSATPDDVKAMFEQGIRSAMQEHDRVAEKGKKRRRIIEVVKEVGAAKQEEEQGDDVGQSSSANAASPSNSNKRRGLEGGLVTLQMMFEGTGLKGGVDIMAGPPGEKPVNLPPLEEMGSPAHASSASSSSPYAMPSRERGMNQEQRDEEEEMLYDRERQAEEGEEEEDEDEWDEGMGQMGDADPLGDVGWDVAERFDVLVRELETASEDMFHTIASQYHNVFLSKHFLSLMRAQMEVADTEAKQGVLLRMVSFAEQLVIQLQEMSQLYEMQQLDKIKAICKVAEEDMSKLSEYVAGRKTELDEDFVKYLHYLIEVEKGRLRDGGVSNPEREPSNWLMILEIVKKGVYHELAKGIKNDVSMIHFITRFDEDDERDYLARAHIQRLAPSQVVPFKRVVTQMVDHFESRVNELKDDELRLAGRVLHVEDILEDMHPDSSLLALLQSPEGGVGLDNYRAGVDSLMHDPREWDHDAVEGLWDAEYLAAKYDRILKHYGFSASRTKGRGLNDGDAEEEGADGRGGKRLPREEMRGDGLPTSSSAPRAFNLEGMDDDDEGSSSSSVGASSSSSSASAGGGGRTT